MLSIMKSLVPAGFLLVCIFSLAGAQQFDCPPDMRKIMERGKLIVAMYGEDRAPFIMKGPDGFLCGIDVDLAQRIGNNLGVPIKIDRRARTFDEIIDMVANEEADIGISLLSATTERARRVLFTEPYLSVHPSLLINRLKEIALKKSGSWHAWMNSPDITIGVMEGSSYEGYAREFFPGKHIVSYRDWGLLKRAVLDGDVLAVLQSGVVLNQMILEEPQIYLKLRFVELTEKEDLFACALPANSIYFLSWVNLLISETGIRDLSRERLEDFMMRNWKERKR